MEVDEPATTAIAGHFMRRKVQSLYVPFKSRIIHFSIKFNIQ